MTPSVTGAETNVKQVAIKFVQVVLCGAFIAAVVLNFANIIGRYVFSAPIYWAEEVMLILFGWCVFLGAAMVALMRDHLKSQALGELLPERLKIFHRIGVDALSLVVVVYIAVKSFDIVILFHRFGQKTIVAEIPKSVVYASISVGLGIVALALLANIIDDIRTILRSRTPARAD